MRAEPDSMRPWETLATATEDGTALVLQRHRTGRGEESSDYEYVIRVDGHVLMTSGAHTSEVALCDVVKQQLAGVARPRVLIGGLGLGFTLRAFLDSMANAAIVVAEISPAIVEWNRTFLAPLSRDALSDPRAEVVTSDVRALIKRGGWDAIVLDVDNGPWALSKRGNAALYGATGLRTAKDALSERGVLVVWSAGDDNAFANRMRDVGFDARTKFVRSGGSRHVLFIGTPTSAAPRHPRPRTK
jgi:spermidine synthase